MAKILFIQYQNMDLLTGESTRLGGAVVQTGEWIKAFHELGHKVIQGKLENDNRAIQPRFNWIKTVDLFHPEKNKKRFCWYTHRLPGFFQAFKNSKCDVVYESIPHWYSVYLAIFCKILKIRFIIRVASDNMMDKRILKEQSRWNVFLIYQAFQYADFI